jgi:hypothetical protein
VFLDGPFDLPGKEELKARFTKGSVMPFDFDEGWLFASGTLHPLNSFAENGFLCTIGSGGCWRKR